MTFDGKVCFVASPRGIASDPDKTANAKAALTAVINAGYHNFLNADTDDFGNDVCKIIDGIKEETGEKLKKYLWIPYADCPFEVERLEKYDLVRFDKYKGEPMTVAYVEGKFVMNNCSAILLCDEGHDGSGDYVLGGHILPKSKWIINICDPKTWVPPQE